MCSPEFRSGNCTNTCHDARTMQAHRQRSTGMPVWDSRLGCPAAQVSRTAASGNRENGSTSRLSQVSHRAAKDSMFTQVGIKETGTAKLERKTAGYRGRWRVVRSSPVLP